jgi:hypothetical protein
MTTDKEFRALAWLVVMRDRTPHLPLGDSRFGAAISRYGQMKTRRWNERMARAGEPKGP